MYYPFYPPFDTHAQTSSMHTRPEVYRHTAEQGCYMAEVRVADKDEVMGVNSPTPGKYM